MSYSTHKHRIGIVEIMYLLMAAVLLLLMGGLAKGQTVTSAKRAHLQTAPVYKEYRGVRLGMTADEARAKLGEPVLKSDEQDFYVFSPNESTQIGYDVTKKVITISTDYSGGIGAPDYKTVVGEGLLERPDGSLFRMVMYDSQRFWVSYNKSASTVPVVTITIGAMR